MPRDSNGAFDLLPNVKGVPLAVIESDDYNNQLDDFADDANTPRPIIAGGTAANSAVSASDNLSTISTPIASASTTDLSAASGKHVTITGNATITSFGTEDAGAVRELTFASNPLLTYNAASLILPTSASIATQVGDTARAVSLGAGNWVITQYMRRSGAALTGSGGTADLGAIYAFSYLTGSF